MSNNGSYVFTRPQVQSGGDFDIDFEVKDPVNEQLIDGQVRPYPIPLTID